MFTKKNGVIYSRGEAMWGCWFNTFHIAAWCRAPMWGALHNTPHNVSSFLLKLSYFVFFWLWSNFCTAVWRPFWAPISSNLVSLEISRCVVSIGFDFNNLELDITFGREVTQCWKFYNTFLEKFTSLNPWFISSSPFYER